MKYTSTKDYFAIRNSGDIAKAFHTRTTTQQRKDIGDIIDQWWDTWKDTAPPEFEIAKERLKTILTTPKRDTLRWK